MKYYVLQIKGLSAEIISVAAPLQFLPQEANIDGNS